MRGTLARCGILGTIGLGATISCGVTSVRASETLQPIWLGAYGNAYFTLVCSDVPVGNRPCQAAAAYVMIRAPNDYLPVVTYASMYGGTINSCTGDLNVSPIRAVPRYQ